MKFGHLRPVVLSLLLLVGCGGGEALILPGDGVPAAIELFRGSGQSGYVGLPLTDPLVFRVTDSRGRPVEGAPVAFELTSAGPEADIIPPTRETNSEGLAEAQFVLGTTIGQQSGRARVVTQQGLPPVATIFSAVALSEDANGMAAVAGEDQTGHVNRPLDDRLVVEVTDGFGNPVSGISITWSAAGGGTVSAERVETGDDGRARVERILGPTVGQQTTLATSEGLAGSPVTFVHTAIAGDASRLIILSGNDQTAAAGSTVPAELVVQLVDADGNGVPRTPLSWVVATGGGAPDPVNTSTDDEGRASTRWTLGETLGEQRIDAVVSGVGFISFRATATAGAPASLFILTQPSSTAQNGVPFARQPVIQVRDARGNDVAVAGIQARASLSGGGELRGTLVIATDAAGRANFTDLAISGDAGTRTLFFEAEGYAGVTSSEIAVAAAPNRPPVAAFTPTCINLGCSFNSEASSDPDGSIVSWRWTFGDGGVDDARNSSHTYGGAGTYQVTLTVTDDRGATHSVTHGVTVAAAPPGNREPFADFNWHCEGLTCHFTDASSDPDGNGTITNRHWVFGDGATVDNELNPSHTYATAGTFRVSLTVTDNGGLTSLSDDDVNPKAQSLQIRRQPSSSAASGVPFSRQPELRLRAGGDDIRQEGVVISASIASGSGTLGGALTATTDEDGRAEFDDLSISGTGSHTIRFTAPGFGETISNPVDLGKASSTTTITGDDPDPSIAGTVVTVNFQVTSGTGTTPTGTVTVSVTGSNPPPDCTEPLSNGTGTCSFTLNVVGDRVFTASYSGDGIHNGSEDQEPHRVDPPNQSPTAAFTAPTCITGQPCAFDGAASDDPDGDIVSYTWDFDDGTATGSGEATSHTFDAARDYQVTLTVTDDDGATGAVEHSVTVTAPNQQPTAGFTWSCVVLTCQFTDQSTDDGEIMGWAWDFGDPLSLDDSSEEENPTYTYLAPGTYTVTLTVTDDDGAASAPKQETFEVTAP